MISRFVTRLLAETYDNVFATRVLSENWNDKPYEKYELDVKELENFLFDLDYEEWFIDIFGQITNLINSDILTQRIKYLHTGRTLALHNTPFKQADDENRLKAGQRYLKRLAEDVLRLYDKAPDSFSDKAKGSLNQLRAQLELDGYVYRNGNLYPVESSVIDVQAEQSYLDSLVDSLGLSDPPTIKHHIQLAEEDYRNNRYSNSIGNSRHFLEAILSQVLQGIAAKLGRSLNPALYKNATDVRTHLEREGLISTDEKDTLKQIYGLLSNTGGHAHIAQKDQARLMWHLALTCSQFVLLRYEGFSKANP